MSQDGLLICGASAEELKAGLGVGALQDRGDGEIARPLGGG